MEKYYTYRNRRYKFSEEKIEFINKTEFWLGHEAVKSLKVVRCHEKLNNGLNGLMGYWDEKDWPEMADGFRYIPHLTSYAVSKQGKVLRDYNGTISQLDNSSYKGYVRISMWVPWLKTPSGDGRSVTYLLHRAIAYCWVKNPNPEKYWLVRHLDDDRSNYAVSNLAWGDHFLNTADALNNFRHPGSKTCVVRNCDTHKVFIFGSLGQFARHIKSSHESIIVHTKLNGGRPYKGVWEIVVCPAVPVKSIKWKYDKPVSVRYNPLTYIVNGIEFSSVKGFVEHYGLSHVVGSSKEYYIKLFKNKFNLDVKVINNYPNEGKIQCLSHKDNKVNIFDKLISAARGSGLNPATVKKLLLKGPSFKKKGFSFRYETDAPWPDKYTDITYKVTSIVATFKDGSTTVFSSIKEVERKTGINKKAVSRHVKNGELYNGILFQEGKSVNQ